MEEQLKREMAFKPWYYSLNGELVKKTKPCVPGDQVHIKRWQGCYNVYESNFNGFVIMKDRKFIQLPWDEFLFRKGEGNSEAADLKRRIRNNLALAEQNVQLMKQSLKELKGLK